MKNKKLKKISFSKLYYSERFKLNELLNAIQIEKLQNFDKLVKLSIRAIANNKKIIFYGNGGSAADSQHLSTELAVRFKNRHPFNSLALTTDVAKITAISNDFNFELIFSKQIESLCDKGDVCIALTTGNSKNLFCCKNCKERCNNILFSGNNGGKLKKLYQIPNYHPF